MLCFSWSSKHDRCKNDRWRYRMAKVTLVFAVLLIALGLAGFLGTGSTHYTALDPSLRLKNGSGQDDAFTGTAEGDSPHIPLQSLTGWECFPMTGYTG